MKIENDWSRAILSFLLLMLCLILAAIVLNAVFWRVDKPPEPEQETVPAAVGGTESPIEEATQEPPTHRLRFPIAEKDCYYSSPFGIRVSPLLEVLKHHDGLDIGGPWRAQVVAVADGRVIEYWPPPDEQFKGHTVLGGLVRIEHADGIESSYGHLSTIYIRGWEQVKAGQTIGRIGSTGISTGPHLHFELRMGGELVNPLLYLSSDFNDGM